MSSLGLALFVGGWVSVTLALHENAFAAPVVKHQVDRHQTVIDTGPYRLVRHPMYAGFIPLAIGMPLWLGSYAAAALAFLRRELPGYTAYTGRVPYRLIPFLW